MIASILLFAAVALATSTDHPIGLFPNVVNGRFHDLARPYNADITVDCHIKRAAYDFAKEIQPERGDHRATFDALQLEQCQMKRPAEDKPLPIPDIENPGFTLFVDIKSGDDANDGSIEHPVKTIEKGLSLIRGHKGRRTLFIREGVYYMEQPLLLTKVDDELVISSYKNEKVVLSGAKEVEVEWKPYRVGEFDVFYNQDILADISFQPGEDVEGRVRYLGKFATSEECQKACAEDETCTGYQWYEADGDFFNQCYGMLTGEFLMNAGSGMVSGVKLNIYVADLSEVEMDEEHFSALYINEKRQILARYPNGNPEYTGYHTNNTGFMADYEGHWLETRTFPAGYEIHLDRPSIEKTLYPNYQIALDGTAVQWTPAISYWALAHPIGGGGCTYQIPTGIRVKMEHWTKRKWSHPEGAIVSDLD